MKLTKRLSLATILLCGALLFTAGCGGNQNPNYEEDVKSGDKDFSLMLTNAAKQEKSYDYKFNFLPEADSGDQGYVGDTMPYYEDGTYYIYYLKDRGDSFNHSVYLATTKDFIHWEEKQEPILKAEGTGQEMMIGTGSVVKVNEKYYFFYTGNNGGTEWKKEHRGEAILVAEGDSPTSFTRKEGWKIEPTASGVHDFRDPQAYYDAANHQIVLTITTPVGGNASIVKYTLNEDLTNATDGGTIYSRDASVIKGTVYNLECSDTFKFGDKWYLTFSAQDGVVWYTTSTTQYGQYADPKPLDGHLFYAAKHVSNGTDTYMVGWTRRSESASDTSATGHLKGWAGNMQVQKVVSDGNGGIRLAPVDAYTQNTEERVLVAGSTVEVNSGDFTEAFRCFERYMVTGKVSHGGKGTFGLAFNFSNKEAEYKMITFSPAENTISFALNKGADPVTSISANLDANKAYSFTYIQEGSVGTLYVEGQNALTVRLYGVSGKNVMLFADGGTATFSELKQYTYTYNRT